MVVIARRRRAEDSKRVADMREGGEMTIAEIKETFKQVRKTQLEIRHIAKMMNNTELSLLPQAIRYDRDKVQVTPDDILAKRAADIEDMRNTLRDTMRILDNRMAYAERMLATLEDSDEREVMRYYYLDTTEDGRLLRWADVAELMGFDERNIYRIHGSALVHLLEKLS